MKFPTPYLILVLTLFNLNAGPLTGVVASVDVGGRLTFQNHDYTGPQGKTGKSTDNNISGVAGTSIGYIKQAEKSKLLIGGEVFFHLSSAKKSYALRIENGEPEGRVNIKNPLTFGGCLIAGAMITPKFYGYGKVGYGWMKSELRYSNLDGESPNHKNYQFYQPGLLAGAAIGAKLGNLLPRLDYTYHLVRSHEPRRDTELVNGVKKNFKYHPVCHTLTLKVGFLF